MNKVSDSILELKETIFKEPTVQEYLTLKKAIKESEELIKLQEDILYFNKNNQSMKAKELMEIYNSHPLIVNYNNVKDDVNDLLNEIKAELENL